MSEEMVDWFEYNGKRYGKYTKVIIKDIYNNREEVAAYFIAIYGHKTVRVLYDSGGRMGYYPYSINQFYTNIISICEENSAEELGITVVKKQDKDIDRLFYGWIWYIFIMLIGFIFNDRILIWIAASVYFFRWRNKVKKEETYYAKW